MGLPRGLEFSCCPAVLQPQGQKQSKGQSMVVVEAPLAPRMSPVELPVAVSRQRAIAYLYNLDEISRASCSVPSPDQTRGSPPSVSYLADRHSKSRPRQPERGLISSSMRSPTRESNCCEALRRRSRPILGWAGRHRTDKELAAEISRCAFMAARFRGQLPVKETGCPGTFPKACCQLKERNALSVCKLR